MIPAQETEDVAPPPSLAYLTTKQGYGSKSKGRPPTSQGRTAKSVACKRRCNRKLCVVFVAYCRSHVDAGIHGGGVDPVPLTPADLCRHVGPRTATRTDQRAVRARPRVPQISQHTARRCSHRGDRRACHRGPHVGGPGRSAGSTWGYTAHAHRRCQVRGSCYAAGSML